MRLPQPDLRRASSFRIFFTASFFVFVLFAFVVPFATAQNPQEERMISSKLALLIKEVDSLQQEQEKLLKAQDETIETIENLKVWSRR